MPVELDSHNSDEEIDIQPDTNQAEALCFLYGNPDFGFKPAEVRQHTSIPNNIAYKALSRLHEKDLIGKTADGYYHALDDPTIDQYAESLRNGEQFNLATEPDEYPDDINETTRGFPEDDMAMKSPVKDDPCDMEADESCEE